MKPIYQNNLRLMPYVAEAIHTPCFTANDNNIGQNDSRPFQYPLYVDIEAPKPYHLDLVIAWQDTMIRDLRMCYDTSSFKI